MTEKLPQICVLFLFWAFGEALRWVLQISIPGSILGMISLTLALEFKLIKLSAVKDASDFLIRNMAFFFIPPGVGLMTKFDIIADNWLSIAVSVVVSTLIVMALTGLVAGRKVDQKEEEEN